MQRNENAYRNIRIGIVGIGSMGKGLLYQSSITPGIDCVAICDTDITRCINAVSWLGLPHSVTEGASAMDQAISNGMVAVCSNGEDLAKCSLIDVMVEASSSIIPAVGHAITALENRKHLVLVNSEIDLMFGPILSKIAARNGLVFTSGDGDQHGVLKRMINEIRLWGFELVMAGNIKGFLDRYANPSTIVHEADKRNLDYRMCTSYTDGTKLNIEMAILSNACGLETQVPGMNGPKAENVRDVFKHFDFEMLWHSRRPFVDYILGAEPGGGVFIIGYCNNPYQKDMLAYYKMGNGPFYLFYRPYHLCHIESMDTIIKAAREGRSLLTPLYGMRTNVYAYAKKDLRQGEKLDGVGGYTCYGIIENLTDNVSCPGLPVCLAEDVALKHAIGRDAKILLQDVDFDPQRLDFKLYSAALDVLPRALPQESNAENITPV